MRVGKGSFIIILMLTACHIFAQNDTINQTDSRGLKQGYWEKFYPNGKHVYHGYFKDNKPVGAMIRYFESGAVRIVQNFKENDPLSAITIYYEDGSKAADGFYHGDKKDSVWNYYSYYDKVIKNQERYNRGEKNGKCYVFFSTGEVFDETNWANGKKEGAWRQFYKNGNIQMITYYKNDNLDGSFKVFSETGKPEVTGSHVKNYRHGKWLYFNNNSEKILELDYQMGQVMNKEALNKKQKEFFDKMEENIGKFKEPELEDFVGQ